MEETVGKLWDRIVRRAAGAGHKEAAVTLEEMRKTLGVVFRALGGDGGLRIEGARSRHSGARRNWVRRMAGSHTRTEQAWRDGDSLRLPPRIDLFADRGLNRDLYLWLAALGTEEAEAPDWFRANQQRTLAVLERYPGMAARYRRLLEAVLAERPDPARLPEGEAEQERAIRRALAEPGSGERLPAAKRPPWPVVLWLEPAPREQGRRKQDTPDREEEGGGGGGSREDEGERRYQAERNETPEKNGLMLTRFEAILSWAEFVRVNRETEEDEDEQAGRAAEDMEAMAVVRDDKPTKRKLRLDLDLPAVDEENQQISGDILLPEWDFKRDALLPDHCRLLPLVAHKAEPRELPEELRRTARRIRRQFEVLAPRKVWLRNQDEGSEVDLDGYLRYASDKALGRSHAAEGLYRAQRAGSRDMACLLLADLSLSTDAWINNDQRIIDVIKDSLYLFAEALAAVGDPFALYGFSSCNRDHVRFHQVKGFAEHYGAPVRGRIDAVRPGYYTRMGAAIRHSANLLAKHPAGRRLLLIISDGKPNDLDRYEGRHGVEDTRMAVLEARRLGLEPFCVTVDSDANDYLGHLFGAGGYVVISKPEELPRKLPLLYARLTRA